MPSNRKRIGFLPSSEVQEIINRICNHNKLSQSKVTGILVEEALISRGELNSSKEINYSDSDSYINDFLSINNIMNSKKNKNKSYSEDKFVEDEVKMINDFIEFKLFKKIMNKKKRNIL